MDYKTIRGFITVHYCGIMDSDDRSNSETYYDNYSKGE